jgi:hypothetical protein
VSAVQTPEEIADLVSGYISENPSAVVVEDGHMLFDFSAAHYSAAPERDRCLLQFWSEERNIVRRATSAEIKNGILKLSVICFGQSKPSRMEICAKAERRSPSALKAMRAAYQRSLERAVTTLFPGWTLDRITTSPTLSIPSARSVRAAFYGEVSSASPSSAAEKVSPRAPLTTPSRSPSSGSIIVVSISLPNRILARLRSSFPKAGPAPRNCACRTFIARLPSGGCSLSTSIPGSARNSTWQPS